ncbi:MAG: flagellar biosynthetic protein FliQ [Planctomycetes bacterium]|nr:flagellar biosynthetic protein FliQ [Planctomycetota bacterium]
MDSGFITVQDVADLANQMMWVTFLLSMPVLLTALVIGVLISLVQTVTGVQEMTITFVPKLMAVFLVIALTLPWMTTTLAEYTEQVWAMLGGM